MTALGRADSWAEVISAVVEDRLRDVHTAIPGRLQSWDPATQRAVVQVTVRTRRETPDGSEKFDTVADLTGVPVQFSSGGGCGVTLPLQPGDPGLIIFAERNIERWLAGNGGGPVDPADVRTFHVSDAVFVPGVRTFGAPLPNVPADAMRVGNMNGAHVRIQAGGSNTADKPVAREGSATVGHNHAGGTAGPYPVTLPTNNPAIAPGEGCQQILVP